MAEETRFRILNKTRETVTLKLQDKPMTFSWEEFNKKLIVVDKVWAILNEDEKKKQDKAEELINNAVVSMMIQNGNGDACTKLTHMAVFGKCIDDAAELLECSRFEVMHLVRQRLMMLNPFMVNPMFSEDEMNRRGIHHKKHCGGKPNRDKDGNREVTSTVDNKPTFGDAFSCLGELKEKMDKEG